MRPRGGCRSRALLRIALAITLSAGAASSRSEETLTTRLDAAEAALQQQGPATALPLFRATLDAGADTMEPALRERALRGIGASQRGLGEYAAARESVEQAIALAREADLQVALGKGLSQLGLVLWEQGDYAQSAQYFRDAIAIARQEGATQLEASALNNLSLINDELGNYTDSIAGYKRALALYAEDPLPRGESDTLSNIGGVHLLLGHYAEALEYYAKALAIDTDLGNAPAIGTDHGNMGLALQGLGEYARADAELSLAIESTRGSGQRTDEAFWLKGKAGVQYDLGNYDQALELHRAALALYERSGALGEELEARADFGELLLHLGDLAGAEAQFDSALSVASRLQHHRGETQALLRLGDLHRYRRQDTEAGRKYADALQRAEAVHDDARTAESLVQIAEVQVREGKPEAARANADRALALADSTGQPYFAARAIYQQALAEERAGHVAVAQQRFRLAVERAATLGNPDLSWRSRFGLGRVLATTDDLPAAIAELEAAVKIIESVRASLQQPRYRSGYLDDKYEVYVELVRLLIRNGQTQRAFSVSEELRAQAARDLQMRPALELPTEPAFALRESALRERIRGLQSSLQSEQMLPSSERRQGAVLAFSRELVSAERDYAELLDEARAARPARAGPADDAALRAALGADEAAIAYVVGSGEVTAFVLRHDALHAMQLGLRRKDLRSRVELLRELIQQSGSTAWQQPARSLAAQLIEPLERQGWLDGARRIHVVPDAELNYLPFAALVREHAGKTRVLVEDYVISLLPSATMLEHHARAAPRNQRMLAIAPGVARLRHANAEVRAIVGKSTAESEVWTGAQALESRFKQVAGGFGLLHLATHGEFNSLNPAFSSLELEPGAGEDGRLQVQEILRMRLDADLVTLSACNTALGSGYFSDVPVGNEFIGLTRAFLQAGSRGVLSSLWAVDDRFTSRFMVEFYREADVWDFPTALASAQRAALSAGGAYVHPYFWAPYVLVGGRTGVLRADIDGNRVSAYVKVDS